MKTIFTLACLLSLAAPSRAAEPDAVPAANGKAVPRLADLACQADVNRFECTVYGDRTTHVVAVTPQGGVNLYRYFRGSKDGKPTAQLLESGSTIDNAAYYEFSQEDYETIAARKIGEIRGAYVVTNERLAPQSRPASCKIYEHQAADKITGTLDLDTRALNNSRSRDVSRELKAKGDEIVDGRCGKTFARVPDSLNYYVTPRHYWGEDILQLPKAALSAPSPSSFVANLHLCQYDGDWSYDEDMTLRCTLSAR